MGNFLQNLLMKYQQFMQGRYGQDTLNYTLFFSALILNGISSIFGIYYVAVVLSTLSTLLYAWSIFRFLSKNIAKRRAENDKFLVLISPFKVLFAKKSRQAKDSTHKYFVCPSCKRTLRVPKGRGKIKIDCPHCGRKFSKRT
ncbi:MAG: hypothetical protein R3Y27_00550 [Clostridia bacterium]